MAFEGVKVDYAFELWNCPYKYSDLIAQGAAEFVFNSSLNLLRDRHISFKNYVAALLVGGNVLEAQ